MVDKMRTYPAVVNDEEMYAHAKEVAQSLLGEENVKLAPQLMGRGGFWVLRAENGWRLLHHWSRQQEHHGDSPFHSLPPLCG